jgi:protein-S-isoprenylcysteine O-methyltransferase Ste14
MYVAVLVVLLGWTLAFQSLELLVYSTLVAVAFHLRVILYEEGRLGRAFGEDWRRYRGRVPRWIGGPGGEKP